MGQITVTKGRTKTIGVGLGFDISQDDFVSEIRAEKNRTSDLLGTWSITKLTDGTDGELVLVLDDAISAAITKDSGWMDIKRVSNGEPIDVFDEPLEVIFEEPVTA